MIVGKRIRLRAIELEDLPLLTKWRNDPAVYDCFYEHEPLSLAMQRRWFDAFLQKRDEKYWIAETLAEGEPIGAIGLLDIDWRNRRAELGRVLVAPGGGRRSGYGRELCELALRYAFDHLNLHRVQLDVFADNQAAVELYRQLGFREEGRLRQHVFARGRYRDVLVFSLLSDERPSGAPGPPEA
jgi:UDP-4-amino-4,6-dideoxy-N-acetyl-beta-L-altrosamine N-acetyltransferase